MSGRHHQQFELAAPTRRLSIPRSTHISTDTQPPESEYDYGDPPAVSIPDLAPLEQENRLAPFGPSYQQ